MSLPLAATWELALLCNYRCPYCFVRWDEPKIGMFHLGISPEDWVKFWDRLEADHGRFHITVAGGEPFVYPGFIQVLERVCKKHMVSINTNLSWEVEAFAGKIDTQAITISASFHPHYEKLETFVFKVMTLRSWGYSVMATVVAFPTYFQKLLLYKNTFEQHQIPYFFQPFQGKYGAKMYPQDYTDDEKLFLYGKSTAMKTDAMDIPMKERSPYGRLCAAGQKRFRVTADGKIFRCAPSIELNEKPLGHIKDENFRLDPEPKPCPAWGCHCPEEFSYLLDLKLEGVLQVETIPQK